MLSKRNVRAKKEMTTLSRGVLTLNLEIAIYSLDGHLQSLFVVLLSPVRITGAEIDCFCGYVIIFIFDFFFFCSAKK